VAGRGERLRALGVVRVAEQPHAQFGLLQRGLAAAVEADARLVGGQRFLEAHVAVLHLLDQLLERVEGALEIGDGGALGVVLGHGAILSRRGARSYTLGPGGVQARRAPRASSQVASAAETMRSPAASTAPSASDSSGSCARSQGGTARSCSTCLSACECLRPGRVMRSPPWRACTLTGCSKAAPSSRSAPPPGSTSGARPSQL